MTEAFSLQLLARNRETKVYRDRGKSLAILLMAGAFFGACFIVFWNDVQAGKLGLPREIVFWACFAVLGIGVLLRVAQLLDSKPVLEFREDGLIARDISNDVIPWTGIRAITARKIKASKFIEVQIDSETIGQLTVTRKARVLRVGNKILGFAPYFISTTALDHNQEFILQLIDFYRKKNEAA